ncbi:MAG: AbrB/MazE/SpoVT family DNA-binding domain-containing protein [Acidobacteria bacterium]|nr:AbrB/MazE/SpoVT family DNA-binding domain-containing protein [Acidobacteriota bacterium]
MRTTIDPAGRVVIPKPMRDALGLSGGRPMEIGEREGVIEIEPAAPMRLEERKGRLVSVPDRELPPLTDDLVRATLERTRR